MPGVTNLLAADEESADSPLIAHARRELDLSGAGDDYDGMIGDCVLELITVLARQRHSGSSAAKTIALFTLLADRQALTDVSSDPAEWNDVSEMSGRPFWQNIRDSRYFSEDGGRTYYNVYD